MMNFSKFNSKIVFLLTAFILLSNCEALKPDWSKTAEPDGKKRARKNVEEGRGFSMGLGKSGGDSNFLFASSNPMWRASLDTIDFITLANVDYAGGLIITDWYSQGDTNEAIKITLRFLSNEIRADGIDIILHKKTCKNNSNCTINKIDSDLSLEIKDTILRKAAILKKEDKKNSKKKRPKKRWGEGDGTNNK
jgi:hypothetical protein